MTTKAVILFSGGLDSTVMLALALKSGKECFALSFDYGQKHRIELERAKMIADHYQVNHIVIRIDPQTFKHSALLSDKEVPKNRNAAEIAKSGIPSTYVPARNTLFLAYAVGQAEIFGAQEIHFGANAMDASPYPDCRPAFVQAYQQLINVATKQALEGSAPKIHTPLIHWDKTEIVKQGKALQIPFDLTWSCYDPTDSLTPCGSCDACVLRSLGMKEKG
jgi:7-cyano-7-deazaguanine synthase